MDTTKELRRLLSEATAGEWVAQGCFPRIDSDERVETGVVVVDRSPSHEWPVVVRPPTDHALDPQAGANARLIAALRNAAPALLDVVDAAEAVLQQQGHYDDCAINKDNSLSAIGPCDCGVGALRTALEALHAR